jgi:hypothetical protein
MTAWEYLIISLPEFEPAKAARGEGVDCWEAVGMTALRDGSFAVLLKRPVEGSND